MSRTTNVNNAPGLPGMQEIIKLAKLLRDNGDKVLSASSKLTFSTMLLHNLNEAFSMIIDETDDLECSFQVCNSSRNEVGVFFIIVLINTLCIFPLVKSELYLLNFHRCFEILNFFMILSKKLLA